MVSVGEKADTVRRATAEGRLGASPEVCRQVLDGKAPKGDVLAVARIAGIQAAKRTAEWIPLCHPLFLTGVEVSVTVEEDGFLVAATCETKGPTGVEMEALTAVSAALLTLYDMLKGQDRTMVITDVKLVEKSGGRSGHFLRPGRG